MNIPPPASRHRPTAPVSLPEELISDILSRLSVKSLTQLRCINKSWNSLISDPIFINLHLKKSAQNPNLAIVTGKDIESCVIPCVIPLPISRLLENRQTPITLPDNDSSCYQMQQTILNTVISVVGACNGLICFAGYYFFTPQSWLCFWNPATRKMSDIFWYDRKYGNCSIMFRKLVFGYDNLSDTYKVVALRLGIEVEVFSSDDNVWRNIQNFPVFPHYHMKDGVYLSGTVNWFVIRNNLNYVVYNSKAVTVDQFVIVSLDLGTETFTQLLPPRSYDFDGVPSFEPALCVLMDCLCYCHDFKESYFVIWQMKEFRVQESWTQFLKISYQNLEIFDFRHLYLLPLCLSGDTLILTNDQERQAILYNLRDNRVERTKITDSTWWWSVKGYVESLVSYH